MGCARVHEALKLGRLYDWKDESRIYDLDGIEQRFGGILANILTSSMPCVFGVRLSYTYTGADYDDLELRGCLNSTASALKIYLAASSFY